jgi:hypothetical protein
MRVQCCEKVIYQLLRALCAVRFVKYYSVLELNKHVPIFCTTQAKNTNSTTNKTVPFFHWHELLYRYRFNLLYRTTCSYLLFNLTQFICCVLERSIQNVLISSQSRCCLYQEQLHVSVSTDRQHNVPKQYKNAIHIDWTYIAFSVLDHNSLQCLVIQQLPVTELFCAA